VGVVEREEVMSVGREARKALSMLIVRGTCVCSCVSYREREREKGRESRGRGGRGEVLRH
jgi:hypothetical protein